MELSGKLASQMSWIVFKTITFTITLSSSSSTLTPPDFTAKVVDAAAIVQSLKPRISKTFGQYAFTEFYNSVFRCLNEEYVQRVAAVFDRYFPLSLTGDTRKGRGSGLRVSAGENTPMVQHEVFER